MRAFNAGSFCIAVALALPLLRSTPVRADDTRSPALTSKGDSRELGPLFRLPPLQAAEPKADVAESPCDVKCSLGALFDPIDLDVSIPKHDGSVAITFSLRPTSITRGKGIVATGRF